MPQNQQITNYIQQASPEQVEILEIVRDLIHKTIPEVQENIKWKMPVFAKTKDFAYFRFSKKHVTLGFYNVDKIEDPNNILEGEGNTLKHIKLRSSEDINEALLTSWFKVIAV